MIACEEITQRNNAELKHLEVLQATQRKPEEVRLASGYSLRYFSARRCGIKIVAMMKVSDY
jgi:hypothetical protein